MRNNRASILIAFLVTFASFSSAVFVLLSPGKSSHPTPQASAGPSASSYRLTPGPLPSRHPDPDSSPSRAATELANILKSRSTGALFNLLFDDRALERKEFSSRLLLSELRRRFALPYPSEPALHQEAIRRAGILRAAARRLAPGAGHGAEAYAWLLGLTRKEEWIVRREALKCLGPWLATVAPGERRLILESAGFRAFASVQLADADLLKSVFEVEADR